MAEAADLQIRPSDPAGDRERLFEVTPTVVHVQRPELGDAEIHQRRGAMVIADRKPMGRPLFDRAHRFLRGREIAALTRHPEPGAGQP